MSGRDGHSEEELACSVYTIPAYLALPIITGNQPTVRYHSGHPLMCEAMAVEVSKLIALTRLLNVEQPHLQDWTHNHHGRSK